MCSGLSSGKTLDKGTCGEIDGQIESSSSSHQDNKLAAERAYDRSTYVFGALGMGCFFGWELTVVYAPGLPPLSFCGLDDAIGLRLLSVLSLAVGFGLQALKSNWVLDHRRHLLLCSLAFALAAAANSAVSIATGESSIVASCIVWMLLGFSQAGLTACWFMFFSMIPTRNTPFAIAMGGVFGTIFFVAVNSSSFTLINIGGAVSLAVFSAGILLYLASSVPAERVEAVREYRQPPALSLRADMSIAMQGMVYGFMTIELCSLGYEAALIGCASGIVGNMLALCWPILGSRVDIDAGVVQRISLPFLVTSILLVPLFDGAARVFFACLANMALAHSTLLNFYMTIVENSEFQLHPVKRLVNMQIPRQIGFLLGCSLAYVLISMTTMDSWTMSLIMSTFAIALVLASSIYFGSEKSLRTQLNEMLAAETSASIEAIKAKEQTESEDDPCKLIVEKYALTAREADVFGLLAKGRNAAAISDKLGVSPSTVKTHIYHIYQKLGINSQQQLISILDDPED